MLQKSDKIALFMPGHLQSDYGKMGFGVLRYAKNKIVAVIDEEHHGKSLKEITGIPHDAPIVSSIDDSLDKGANVCAKLSKFSFLEYFSCTQSLKIWISPVILVVPLYQLGILFYYQINIYNQFFSF